MKPLPADLRLQVAKTLVEQPCKPRERTASCLSLSRPLRIHWFGRLPRKGKPPKHNESKIKLSPSKFDWRVLLGDVSARGIVGIREGVVHRARPAGDTKIDLHAGKFRPQM